MIHIISLSRRRAALLGRLPEFRRRNAIDFRKHLGGPPFLAARGRVGEEI